MTYNNNTAYMMKPSIRNSAIADKPHDAFVQWLIPKNTPLPHVLPCRYQPSRWKVWSL